MELELATGEELFDELKKRYEAILLVTVAPCENGVENAKGGMIHTSWCGGAVAALGLAVVAKDTINDYIKGDQNEEE